MSDESVQYTLGETAGVVLPGGLNGLQAHCCQMASQSRRRLLIYTQRLNPAIYDQRCFLDAVRSLVIRHANTRIQILVADTAQLGKGGHRLIELARDMTSSIAIRRRAEEFSGDERSFMIADQSGYLLRNLWYDLNGARGDYCDRPQSDRLAGEFVRVWERSEPDPALRRLAL